MINFNIIFNFSTEVSCDVFSYIFVHGLNHLFRENYNLHLQSSLWLKLQPTSAEQSMAKTKAYICRAVYG